MDQRTLRGRRDRALVALGFVWVLLMATIGVGSPVGAQDDSTDQPVLYLTERPFDVNRDQWNFTAFAPDENETTATRNAEQAAFPSFLATWQWYLPSAPENWTLSAGTQWELHLFISGLDEVHPFPTFSSLGTAGHEFQVVVYSGQDPIGKGELVVSVLDVEEGVHQYPIMIEFPDEKRFSPGDGSPHLLFEISVSGRGVDPESPLEAHFGSVEHPSHLVTRSYPLEAFREVELAYLLEQECAALILQQKSCAELQRRAQNTTSGSDGDGDGEDPDGGSENGNANPGSNGGDGDGGHTGDPDDADTNTVPAPGVLFVGIFSAFGAWLLRARKTVH